MITFVTFKWKPREGYRSKFGVEHVNTLASMIERNYRRPHRFMCVTDDTVGLDWGIDTMPLWTDHTNLRNPTWPDGPNCFPRLRALSREFGEAVGTRYVCLDLDLVITADITGMFDIPQSFAMMKTHLPHIPLCGSIVMSDPGAVSHVWDRFDANPAQAIGEMQRAGRRGSDQAWITHCMGPNVAGWGPAEGVYSYMQLVPKHNTSRRRGYVAPNFPVGKVGKLPADARIVVFTGKPDPWDAEARKLSPWIDDHYY